MAVTIEVNLSDRVFQQFNRLIDVMENVGQRGAAAFAPANQTLNQYTANLQQNNTTLNQHNQILDVTIDQSQRYVQVINNVELGNRRFRTGTGQAANETRKMGKSLRGVSWQLLELGRGFEDAAIGYELGGFKGALRGSLNNLTQIAALVGPVAGGIAGIAAAAIFAGPAVIRWAMGLESANDVIDQIKKNAPDTADAIRGLFDSEDISRIDSYQEAMKKLEAAERSLQENRARGSDQDALAGSLNERYLESISSTLGERILGERGTARSGVPAWINDPARSGLDFLEHTGGLLRTMLGDDITGELQKAMEAARESAKQIEKEAERQERRVAQLREQARKNEAALRSKEAEERREVARQIERDRIQATIRSNRAVLKLQERHAVDELRLARATAEQRSSVQDSIASASVSSESVIRDLDKMLKQAESMSKAQAGGLARRPLSRADRQQRNAIRAQTDAQVQQLRALAGSLEGARPDTAAERLAQSIEDGQKAISQFRTASNAAHATQLGNLKEIQAEEERLLKMTTQDALDKKLAAIEDEETKRSEFRKEQAKAQQELAELQQKHEKERHELARKFSEEEQRLAKDLADKRIELEGEVAAEKVRKEREAAEKRIQIALEERNKREQLLRGGARERNVANRLFRGFNQGQVVEQIANQRKQAALASAQEGLSERELQDIANRARRSAFRDARYGRIGTKEVSTAMANLASQVLAKQQQQGLINGETAQVLTKVAEETAKAAQVESEITAQLNRVEAALQAIGRTRDSTKQKLAKGYGK